MNRVRFSFLIPSRNRLDLLKLAVESVAAEKCDSFEIVIADNCSSENYSEYIADISSRLPVRYVRSETPISVTENWNAALNASSGEYIVMLGDDDALAPGYCKAVDDVIRKFDAPQVIYCMAYHYAYPGAIEPRPEGYLASVKNSPVFKGTSAYLLNSKRARALSRMALRFRHWFSFNAQHYVWKREFAEELKKTGFRLFESPYPDYYASMVTFMLASSIVVIPYPIIIVGISKKSFGHALMSNNEEAGYREFFHDPNNPDWFDRLPDDVKKALALPSTKHFRSWLLAAIWASQALSALPYARLDARRYEHLQKKTDTPPGEKLPWADQIYYQAHVKEFDIGRHANILDATAYLAKYWKGKTCEFLARLKNLFR